jgi:hypothetical protein
MILLRLNIHYDPRIQWMILSRLNICCDSLTINTSNGSTGLHNGNKVHIDSKSIDGYMN